MFRSSLWRVFVSFSVGVAAESVWGRMDSPEKHARDMDLACVSYQDLDWPWLKKDMWRLLGSPEKTGILHI